MHLCVRVTINVTGNNPELELIGDGEGSINRLRCPLLIPPSSVQDICVACSFLFAFDGWCLHAIPALFSTVRCDAVRGGDLEGMHALLDALVVDICCNVLKENGFRVRSTYYIVN